jgi:hypothetical protein
MPDWRVQLLQRPSSADPRRFGMLNDAALALQCSDFAEQYADPLTIAYLPLRMVCRMAAAAGANAIEPDYGGSPPVHRPPRGCQSQALSACAF